MSEQNGITPGSMDAGRSRQYDADPYTSEEALRSLISGLSTKVEPTPQADTDGEQEGGIIRRSNEFRTKLGSLALESVALHGMEINKAVRKRANELYRNQFPLLVPAFALKCTECETEYESDDREQCAVCGGTDLREPDREERSDAEAFFESVNDEGQSLRELYKLLAEDAGRLGGWVHLIRHNYAAVSAGGDTTILSTPVELTRADSKRVKPVVNEHGRIGGVWWACPIHRDDTHDAPGQCAECGADLREVHYAEVERLSDETPKAVYFEHEVVTHAAFTPRLNGLDWISPVATLWKRQAILEWMNTYAAGFFDENSDSRYPGTMAIVHTSNRQAFDKQLAEAKDRKESDPYAQGILYNQVPEGVDAETGVQILDMMNDEILGQQADLKQDFKRDIRNVYGLSDAQDSELSDAGGLNNEGLQLETTDRDIAAFQSELMDGPLEKLMKVLGFDDWRIRFVPPKREDDELSELDVVNAAARAEEAGISYAIEDGSFRVADTDGVKTPEADEPAPDGAPQPGAPQGEEPEPEEDEDGPLAQLGEGVIEKAMSEYDSADAGRACEAIEAMHAKTLWPDGLDLSSDGTTLEYESGSLDASLTATLSQETAQPALADDEDVPEFTAELIEDAIEGGAIVKPDALSRSEFSEMESIVEENLTQPQGWSIQSVADDLQSAFDVSSEKADLWATNATQNVLQSARLLGYSVSDPPLDERWFSFAGPRHSTICEACELLLDETNPKYGGTPMRWNDIIDRIDDVNSEYFDHENTGAQCHISCTHTVTERRDLRGVSERDLP